MSKRFRVLAGLVGVLALLPSTGEAQEANKVSFGVMGGLSLPVGSFGDMYESGYNITGSVHFPLGEKLRLRGDVGYEKFAAKSLLGSMLGSDFDVLSFAGNVVVPFGQAASAGGIRPYVLGGLGFYRTSTTYVANVQTSNTDVGLSVGGGLEFALSGFTTFAELRFTNVWTGSNRGVAGIGESSNSSGWIPITFGIRF